MIRFGFGFGLNGVNSRDPSNFGNLIGAWYGDTGITLNGANVSSWAPAYGNAAPLAQATAAAQPLANVAMPNGNTALGFNADALCTTLPVELTSDYFSIVMAVCGRNGGRAWGVRNSVGAYAAANHITALSSQMFTGVGAGPVSSSATSSAVIGFSANIGGTNQKAWGSGSGLVTYSGAFTFSGSSIASFCLGAHDSTGAAGAICNYGALWLFGGAEIDLAAACLRMAQLYPEVV